MTVTFGRLGASLADRYRLERELGQGGMATVYLAHDLKHDRQVAIKVLKPELAAVLGAERFVQEIKTTAALQHPHILPLFDSGQADGFLYYVMPYIEGETLRTRLEREHQLGIDEAVKITTEVADALDYAHRHGVIHRDIKPENILLHDGRPMVADFGIALAVSAAAGGRMTETGLSLGTPHYMSPEQATADREITGRSDIYSLASVLYEMLTGEPPHMGTSAQQIIMKIIAEPVRPATELRKSVPPNVAAAMSKALEKLPADRFESAKAFAEALANSAFTTRAVRVASDGTSRRSNRRFVGIGAVAVVAIAAALTGWLRPRPGAPTARFEVAPPAGIAFSTGLGHGTILAVSRDGRTFAFIAQDSGGVPRLWVKHEGDLDPRPVPGTDGAYSPFVSPDGSQVGFIRDVPSRRLEVVALDGGAPRTLVLGGDSAAVSMGTSGAAWGTDGYIYYDADESGIRRIRPEGGAPEAVLALDSAQGDGGFAWPEVIAEGGVLVVRVRRGDDGPERFKTVASRIGSGTYTEVADGVLARYHAHQLFVVSADGTVRAGRFDTRRLRLVGQRRIVASGLRVAGSYAGADLVVDDRGTTHYLAGQAGLGRTLSWVDFAGRRTRADPTWLVPSGVSFISPAPDARQVVMGGNAAIGFRIKQLPNGATLQFPVDSGRLLGGDWSADGASFLLAYRRGRTTVVVRQRADGLGRPVTVTRDSLWITGLRESRDGHWILAMTGDSTGPAGLAVLEEGRDATLRQLLPTAAAVTRLALSPDGRWLAYLSDRSGRPEVYVQPFPRMDRIWQVSIDGGREPVWAPAGNRLYFYRPATGLMAVDVSSGPAFGRPRVVLAQPQLTGTWLDQGWGISPDGARVLVMATVSGEGSVRLVRVEHVTTELSTRSGQ